MKKSWKRRRLIGDVSIQILLTVLALLWLVPIVWILLTSLRAGGGTFQPNFIPKAFTFDNYVRLFTDPVYRFPRWFLNTFGVAVLSGALSTVFTLATAYVLSRFRFKMRGPMMKIALILGMFPGFMSMIAVYYILKVTGITDREDPLQLLSLVLIYSGGAAMGYYISKGFFDTVPRTLDEAARIDGATNFKIFTSIILPLSKPILVYTVLTAFMAPWMDFIFAKVVLGDKYDNYTVAVGLFYLIDREHIADYFTVFAAGCVCIGALITALFLFLQKYFVEGVSAGAVKG